MFFTAEDAELFAENAKKSHYNKPLCVFLRKGVYLCIMRIKTKILFFALCLICGLFSYSQNLVQNGSFELYDTCPSTINGGLIRYADYWVNPNNATPDYFNACDVSGSYSVPYNISGGYQYPYEGNAYIGLVMYVDTPFVNAREYAQIQLTSGLQTDSCYRLRFYVSIGDMLAYYKITNFDAYFSATAISSTDSKLLPYTPQFVYTDPAGIADSSSWKMIEGIFQAQGGENFMTIGNFHNDSNTTRIVYDPTCIYGGYGYYFIDSISLIKVTCPLNIGIDENEQASFFKLHPNPNDGNMIFEYSLQENTKGIFMLYDVTGRLVNSYTLNQGMNNSMKISEDALQNGIYFYKVIVNDEMIQSDKLIILK